MRFGVLVGWGQVHGDNREKLKRVFCTCRRMEARSHAMVHVCSAA